MVVYKMTFGFAVVDVINGVFMQETFKAAANGCSEADGEDHLARLPAGKRTRSAGESRGTPVILQRVTLWQGLGVN